VTGSSYIPIVVPIMAFLAMGLWLGLVFYADGHPGHRRTTHRRGRRGTPAASGETAEAAPGARGRALPGATGPAGPREHERIDVHAADGARR